MAGNGCAQPEREAARLRLHGIRPRLIRMVTLNGPSQVTVAFGKAKGNIDGVNVYSRRQGTSQWNFLARDTEPPYVDTTPLAQAGQPEIREYRIRAVIDDEEIGDYSVTKQVTVS